MHWRVYPERVAKKFIDGAPFIWSCTYILGVRSANVSGMFAKLDIARCNIQCPEINFYGHFAAAGASDQQADGNCYSASVTTIYPPA